ncbi:MAG: BrnA antitoxin family protein [Methylococcales bacterium]
MNRNSISQTSDDFDEYPEISQSDLNRAVKRRNFVAKQNVNLALDADIVSWLKRKAGEVDYQAFVNSTLREAMTRTV